MSDMGAFTPSWGKVVDNLGGIGAQLSVFLLSFFFTGKTAVGIQRLSTRSQRLFTQWKVDTLSWTGVLTSIHKKPCGYYYYLYLLKGWGWRTLWKTFKQEPCISQAHGYLWVWEVRREIHRRTTRVSGCSSLGLQKSFDSPNHDRFIRNCYRSKKQWSFSLRLRLGNLK